MGTGAAVPAAGLAGMDAGQREAGMDAGLPLAAFVPAGFRVEEVVRGDLDGRGPHDAVLVLERREPDGRGARARRLVVLRGRGPDSLRRARYVRAGEGRQVLLCSICGGDVHAPEPTPVVVRIRAREVVVRQFYGSRVITTQTFRFRLRDGGVRLTRYEERNWDCASGRWALASTDLLTGGQTIETGDRKGGGTFDAFEDRPRRIMLEDSLQGAPLHEPGRPPRA